MIRPIMLQSAKPVAFGCLDNDKKNDGFKTFSEIYHENAYVHNNNIYTPFERGIVENQEVLNRKLDQLAEQNKLILKALYPSD